jgi:hypothetical protein
MDEEVRTYLEGMEQRLGEKLRVLQAEMMAALQSLSVDQAVRLRKLEENQSTLEYLGQKRRCP